MQAETRIYFTWEEVCELLTREAAKIAQFDLDGSKVLVGNQHIEKTPYFTVVALAIEPKKPSKPTRSKP